MYWICLSNNLYVIFSSQCTWCYAFLPKIFHLKFFRFTCRAPTIQRNHAKKQNKNRKKRRRRIWLHIKHSTHNRCQHILFLFFVKLQITVTHSVVLQMHWRDKKNWISIGNRCFRLWRSEKSLYLRENKSTELDTSKSERLASSHQIR